MGKALKQAAITGAAARRKLPLGDHWRELVGDAHIGYRKAPRGAVWVVRWRNRSGSGKPYHSKTIGPANDVNDKATPGLLTYLQAEAKARDMVAEVRAEIEAKANGSLLTVADAVEDYMVMRDARDSRRAGRPVRSDGRNRLERYVVGRPARGGRKAIQAAPLATVALYALKESDLRKWREALPLADANKRRLMGDLKSALNAAWATLPDGAKAQNPLYRETIKSGMKAEAADDDADSSARDNQILTDRQIAAVLRAAMQLGDDTYRLVVALDATGARYSQVARVTVGDLQVRECRLLVPGSRKGRGGRPDIVPVPISQEVLEVLLAAAAGRPTHEPLLLRDHHEQGAVGEWTVTGRRGWRPNELTRPWQAIRKLAGLAGDIDAYSLRHSSIVRGLRAGLPIALVAKRHNTSAGMIERHYGKFIATALEDLERAALANRAAVLPTGGDNVVRLA